MTTFCSAVTWKCSLIWWNQNWTSGPWYKALHLSETQDWSSETRVKHDGGNIMRWKCFSWLRTRKLVTAYTLSHIFFFAHIFETVLETIWRNCTVVQRERKSKWWILLSTYCCCIYCAVVGIFHLKASWQWWQILFIITRLTQSFCDRVDTLTCMSHTVLYTYSTCSGHYLC